MIQKILLIGISGLILLIGSEQMNESVGFLNWEFIAGAVFAVIVSKV